MLCFLESDAPALRDEDHPELKRAQRISCASFTAESEKHLKRAAKPLPTHRKTATDEAASLKDEMSVVIPPSSRHPEG
jgi:hypothetical protein